ncbi:MAG: (d)CMP kinase [Roseovarius sp.]|nr:(d)CMP kinase [Roseovarius sp.]MCY4209139.1 (d)CMP kinase [Roseovarius sp.]MCY4290585.1 (d)CMP kinase [Roseovarius sp.]
MIFTVAIDGPAAAGKGTVGRAVADHFGFAYLDTGLLYRATGRRMLNGEDPIIAANALVPDDINRHNLRTPEITKAASVVAAIPEVRKELVVFQRVFARQSGGTVLDGRDIGTVICPDAEVKIFITASNRVRAQRRYRELRKKGHDMDIGAVFNDIRDRDARDSERSTAPLKPAEDAAVLDTTNLDIADAVNNALQIVKSRLA